MISRWLRPLIGALAMFALEGFGPSSVAFAQSTISGLVGDTSGAVLPGVTVEASSPVLIEGVRSAVSDANGRYSIVNLRPGVYSVTFNLSGFSPVKREGLEVAANTTVPLNVELRVGALEETVVVTGASPVVDVQQAARTQVLQKDLLDALPTARTYGSVGALVPGAKLSRPDMGGIAAYQQAYVRIRGKDGRENSFEIDGMDVRTNLGCESTYYTNFAMVQELTVQTDAISAESPGGGARINMIPREGGNTFKGDIYFGGMAGAFQSDNINDELRQKGLATPDATDRMVDTAVALGGRIVRDKLWFFGAGRIWRVRVAPAGAHYFSDGRKGVNDTSADSASGRMTWQMSRRNKLTFYYDQSWKTQSNTNTGNSGPGGEYGPGGIDWGTATTIQTPGLRYISQAKWTFASSNRLLFEAGATHSDYGSELSVYLPGVLKDPFTPEWYASAARLDFVRGTLHTAPGSAKSQLSNLPVSGVMGAVSYVTGSHNLKVGIQNRFGSARHFFDIGNAALVQRYRDGVPDAVDVSPTPVLRRRSLDFDGGVFVADSWVLGRLTTNVGMRYDFFRAHILPSNSDAGRFVSVRTIPESYPLPTYHTLAPRLSLVYDLFGNAKTALKVTANKYVNQYGVNIVDPYHAASTASDRRNWFDTDLVPGTTTPSGRTLPTNGDDIAQDNEIGPSNNLNFGTAATSRADPSQKRPYEWDYSVSVQHELLPRVGVIAAWYRQQSYDVLGTTNAAVSFDDFRPFQVANPLGNGEQITVFNLDRQKQGLVDNLIRNSDVNTQRYDGFEASIQARLPKGGTVFGGWSAERLLRTTCDVPDPNQLRFCDQSGKLYQEYGVVPAQPYRHEYKIAGTYPLPKQMTASASLVSFPGGTGTLNGRSLVQNWAVPANLFPGGRTQVVTVNLIPPGTQWLKRWNQLDVALRQNLRLGRYDVQTSAEVFNLLNSGVVLTQSENFGPALGTPTSILQGRFLKLAVTIKY